MLNENKALLFKLVGDEQILNNPYQTQPVILDSGKFCCSDGECIHDIWFSPTGFGYKDDAKSIGYLLLPVQVFLNEHKARNYKFSTVSTSVSALLLKDFKAKIPLPVCPVEHQKLFFPALFIK
jgi:hypothetical protein